METKPKRPNYQPYVPVHRRKQAAELTSQQPTMNRQQQQVDTSTEVKRRGRGQFRAPPPSNSNTIADNRVDNKPIKLEEERKIETIDLAEEFEVKVQIDTNQPSLLQNEQVKIETVGNQPDKNVEKEDWEALLDDDDDDDDDDEKSIQKPIVNSNIKKKVEPVKVDEKVLEDITTVLDCYDFPSSFKSHHLQDVFREYEKMRGGYQIKWMDDSRALIIFYHPATAKKAYVDLLSSSIVKVKPYKGQIEIKPSGPVPRRPVTTDMVAKRLVHGALGVKTVKTPEQRAAEKELLKAAREQRDLDRLENQKRQKEVASAFDD